MFARLTLTLFLLTHLPVRGNLVEVPELGLRIAPGFSITRYADHALAPDVYSMTLDLQGRVVISSRGYIRRLLDRDGDGVADGVQQIAPSAAGAMGMLFIDEKTLLTVEGGALNRYTDTEGDGSIDPKPEKIAQFGGGEHGAHALRTDSSGAIFLIGGNDAKFRGHQIINEKQRDIIEGGALLRFDPGLKMALVVAHGFRNPYDFDADSLGQLYCYDSDCERDFLLPWYSPTRLYRIQPGAHHGWRLSGWKRSWKRPDYYPDSVQPLVNVGRGSPTGVAVYRHHQFPDEYREAVFYCDWTFGRVYSTPSSSGLGELLPPAAELFIESSGSNGFAPTDIEFAPDGSMFLSMGGRGTSGSVFHVRYNRPTPKAPKHDLEDSMPSWGRGLQPVAGPGLSMERARGLALELEAALLEEPLVPRGVLLRNLMVALGDWNLKKPSAEVFTGYELSSEEIFAEVNRELLLLCRRTPRDLLHSLDPDERREAARMLAMLRDPHPLTAARLLKEINPESSPIEDFHFLACLARIEAPLDESALKQVASAILGLDEKTSGRQLRSKQNYIARLNELVAHLAKRAPIYDALLADQRLFAPNHAGIAAAFPAQRRGFIATGFLLALSQRPGAGWRSDAIELLAPIPTAENRALLRDLSGDPLLAPACARLLARQPEERDRTLFLKVGELAGLEKLTPMADAGNLVPLFRAADGKRALKLIGRAAGVEFANRAAAEAWLRDEKPEVAAALGLGKQAEKIDWAERLAGVQWNSGDAARGKALFGARACATCHASSNALGPDLSGASKRLSPTDLFAAIVSPNADVPEAYRATVITMQDGSRHVGRLAFTSADGRIVQTATGTLRLKEEEIVSEESWSRSLMPEGLLNGLEDAQLADLHAYLKTL